MLPARTRGAEAARFVLEVTGMALGTGHQSQLVEMWIVEDLTQRRDSGLFTVFCAMTESDNEPVDRAEVWI